MNIIKKPIPGKWYGMDCRPEVKRGEDCCIVVFACDAEYSDDPEDEGDPIHYFAIGGFNDDGTAIREDTQDDAYESAFSWTILTDTPFYLVERALN